ncbi:head-tail connector protein [Anaerosolibacter carboniphilus]|uniref:head-tail connector protein n=1 Tax=Anaerosolibacter carboniphilus TaxID=1417629 RepID=UPI002ED242D3
MQAVRDYLKITWDDEDTMIQDLITRGKTYLNGLVGVELDFDVEDEPKSLLLDYCRYAYNNALEYFEDNFKTQILRLQLKKAVDAYVEI